MTTEEQRKVALDKRTEKICEIAYDVKLQAETRRRLIRREVQALHGEMAEEFDPNSFEGVIR